MYITEFWIYFRLIPWSASQQLAASFSTFSPSSQFEVGFDQQQSFIVVRCTMTAQLSLSIDARRVEVNNTSPSIEFAKYSYNAVSIAVTNLIAFLQYYYTWLSIEPSMEFCLEVPSIYLSIGDNSCVAETIVCRGWLLTKGPRMVITLLLADSSGGATLYGSGWSWPMQRRDNSTYHRLWQVSMCHPPPPPPPSPNPHLASNMWDGYYDHFGIMDMTDMMTKT